MHLVWCNKIILLSIISFISTLGNAEATAISPREPEINQKPNSLAIEVQPKNKAKNIEMVFVLDTTGSMGGLIEGAKNKIWRIVNDVMQGKDKVNLKLGLVAYRDRGDRYVTEVTPLSDDLDKVYGKLMAYVADGGGDGPEDQRRPGRRAARLPAVV